MDISSLLSEMVAAGASDLFLSASAPAYIKVEGDLKPVPNTQFSSSQVQHLVYSILTEDQLLQFESTSELNISLRLESVGRFRINVFRQMGSIALVARHIHSEIPSIEALGLPPILKELIMKPRGLVLLVGGTGTGKSTSLASMIDYRNRNKTGHILTIEDPIEFVYDNQRSLVNQREVGLDTDSYSVALKNAMREAPDVILIGEIRDTETMKSAMAYAETGHLCISTLHANNSYQAIDRILNFFPEEAHPQLLQDLAFNLRAIVSQRLPLGIQGKRVPAVEVMLNTPYIADLISKSKISNIKEAMNQSVEQGCQTFDDELFKLVQKGVVSEEEALKNADSSTNLMLRFKLEGKKDDSHLDIKKDIAYAKFCRFDAYTSYKLTCISISEDLKDQLDNIEGSLRHVFFQKGLREDEAPDLEIQFVVSSKSIGADKLSDVRDAISSDVPVYEMGKKYGLVKVNVVDVAQHKVVWQVKASRELGIIPRSLVQLHKDFEYLFDEFPPEMG